MAPSYANPGVTVDVVIFTIEDDQLKILLINRAHAPYQGRWALPGGFLHVKEDTRLAAERILRQKAGLENVYLEQLYTFDDLKRDPRGYIISITYFALAPRELIDPQIGQGTQKPTFFPVKNLPKLAFDHDHIAAYALRRLRAKLEYTNIVYSILPREFTMQQLQQAYEIILGQDLDKRNFQKKFFSLDLIKPTNKMLRGKPQRPARLYRFKSTVPTELSKFF